MRNEIPLSDIVEVNPPTVRPMLEDTDEVSFIPMCDVTDDGRWICGKRRRLKEVKQGYTSFQEGDVLFAKITPCMENGKGCLAVGLANDIGFGSTEFHILRAKQDADPRFVFQWSVSRDLRRRAAARMVGSAGQQRVPARFLREFRIPAFSKVEQEKIAEVLSVLDRAIEQSEAAVAKQRRIKTGVMRDLLRRGIDEGGQLRDVSTHEFKLSPLGAIPAEWTLLDLRRLATSITSGSRGWARYYSTEGAKFIRIGNLTREHVDLLLDDIQHVQPPVGREARRTSVQTGDVLISITADLGIVGVAAPGLGRAYVNQHIALVRLDRAQINPWWVGNFLAGEAAQRLICTLNDAGAKAGLNLATIGSIPIPRPSTREQDAVADIARCLDDRLLQCRRSLLKLRRLKHGLMDALLSGNIALAPLLAKVQDKEGP